MRHLRRHQRVFVRNDEPVADLNEDWRHEMLKIQNLGQPNLPMGSVIFAALVLLTSSTNANELWTCSITGQINKEPKLVQLEVKRAAVGELAIFHGQGFNQPFLIMQSNPLGLV